VATDRRRPAKLPAHVGRQRRVAPQGVDATGRRPTAHDHAQATPLSDVQRESGDGPLEGPARQAGRAVYVARHSQVRERELPTGHNGKLYHCSTAQCNTHIILSNNMYHNNICALDLTYRKHTVMKLAPPLWPIHFKPPPIFSKLIANNCKLIFGICQSGAKTQINKYVWGANFMTIVNTVIDVIYFYRMTQNVYTLYNVYISWANLFLNFVVNIPS